MGFRLEGSVQPHRQALIVPQPLHREDVGDRRARQPVGLVGAGEGIGVAAMKATARFLAARLDQRLVQGVRPAPGLLDYARLELGEFNFRKLAVADSDDEVDAHEH